MGSGTSTFGILGLPRHRAALGPPSAAAATAAGARAGSRGWPAISAATARNSPGARRDRGRNSGGAPALLALKALVSAGAQISAVLKSLQSWRWQ